MPATRTPDDVPASPPGGRPPVPADDADWRAVLAARGGDREALAPIIRRAVDSTRTLIRRAAIYGHAVGDLEQGAALRALEALQRYNPAYSVPVRAFAAI